MKKTSESEEKSAETRVMDRETVREGRDKKRGEMRRGTVVLIDE